MKHNSHAIYTPRRPMREGRGLARAVSFHAPLPADCIAALDAEGEVNGKTWRDMRVGCSTRRKADVISQSFQAMAWFWWKRGLASCFTDMVQMNRASRAARDALRAIGTEEMASDETLACAADEEGEIL